MKALKKYLKMGFEFTWYVLPSVVKWLWAILISPLWSYIRRLLRRLVSEERGKTIIYITLYIGGALGMGLVLIGFYIIGIEIIGGAF